MDLKDVFGQKPILVAIAGPNGAGKSTFYEAHLADAGLYYVNADVLAITLGIDAYAAAKLANNLRQDFVKQRRSLIFETVFSDPVGDKVAFLKAAEKSGYAVLLVFIGIESPQQSDMRVAMRAAGGGHDVPSQKLIERFPRTMQNLKRAFVELRNILVYDHSDLDLGYRLVAAVENGRGVALHEPVPEWLRPLLP